MYKSMCFEGCPIESSAEDAAIEWAATTGQQRSGDVDFARGGDVGFDGVEASQFGRGLGQAFVRSSKSK
jgi:hypothetical protein